MILHNLQKTAEILTAKYGTKATILRLSRLYGLSNGRNLSFIDKIFYSIRSHEPLYLIAKLQRSFLYVKDAAEGIKRIIEKKPKYLLYHLGGPEKSSSYDIGLMFARLLNVQSTVVTEEVIPSVKDLPELIEREFF